MEATGHHFGGDPCRRENDGDHELTAPVNSGRCLHHSRGHAHIATELLFTCDRRGECIGGGEVDFGHSVGDAVGERALGG